MPGVERICAHIKAPAVAAYNHMEATGAKKVQDFVKDLNFLNRDFAPVVFV